MSHRAIAHIFVIFTLCAGITGCWGRREAAAKRDEKTFAKPPEESQHDRAISERIRTQLARNETLTFSSQNISIKTTDGTVSLRGPVKDEHEQAEIVATARSTAGVERVDDDLQVLR